MPIVRFLLVGQSGNGKSVLGTIVHGAIRVCEEIPLIMLADARGVVTINAEGSALTIGARVLPLRSQIIGAAACDRAFVVPLGTEAACADLVRVCIAIMRGRGRDIGLCTIRLGAGASLAG